ncbi:hypothetical protein E4T46_01605 [Aureobasidium subglaciale]|nr:hypothetical protein E4T40_01608 [Aureobasidium subglaciale]KAI5266362.1 hypothetical protein E4T46_01605 [Aureobasidium subglaciale]
MVAVLGIVAVVGVARTELSDEDPLDIRPLDTEDLEEGDREEFEELERLELRLAVLEDAMVDNIDAEAEARFAEDEIDDERLEFEELDAGDDDELLEDDRLLDVEEILLDDRDAETETISAEDETADILVVKDERTVRLVEDVDVTKTEDDGGLIREMLEEALEDVNEEGAEVVKVSGDVKVVRAKTGDDAEGTDEDNEEGTKGPDGDDTWVGSTVLAASRVDADKVLCGGNEGDKVTWVRDNDTEVTSGSVDGSSDGDDDDDGSSDGDDDDDGSVLVLKPVDTGSVEDGRTLVEETTNEIGDVVDNVTAFDPLLAVVEMLDTSAEAEGCETDADVAGTALVGVALEERVLTMFTLLDELLEKLLVAELSDAEAVTPPAKLLSEDDVDDETLEELDEEALELRTGDRELEELELDEDEALETDALICPAVLLSEDDTLDEDEDDRLEFDEEDSVDELLLDAEKLDEDDENEESELEVDVVVVVTPVYTTLPAELVVYPVGYTVMVTVTGHDSKLWSSRAKSSGFVEYIIFVKAIGNSA